MAALNNSPGGLSLASGMSNLLILDEDSSLRADVSRFFHNLGHSVFQAADCPAALELLKEHAIDVIVGQVRACGGIPELLRAARASNPEAALIVEAELDSVEQGVQAVRAGAFSLLHKPYSLPELNFQIKRALEARAERGPSPGLVDRYQNVYRPYSFIGESPQIREVFAVVRRVAGTDSSVIIAGETGTGKELVAGAIHYNSPRSDGPFVRVNCAALPEQLLESELFGHEKGSFTGADRLRIGRFEHANGGTLFLDEVADLSLFTQAKLLRVLQEKEFERLGSNEPIRTDVRILSATNRDLAERRRSGLFRDDLYYRLNVITIRLPALREREGDIPLLAQFFIQKYAARMNRKVRGLRPEALRLLTGYHWPGNIRELENTLERAVLLSDGELIGPEDLNLGLAPPASEAAGPAGMSGDGAELATASPPGGGPPPAGLSLEQAERRLVLQALERAAWVQKEAARLLGLSSRALNYRIRKLGITHPSWRQNRG
jgi:DNA-binding NtrC family response regulator